MNDRHENLKQGGSDAGCVQASAVVRNTEQYSNQHSPDMVERMGEALFALSDSLRESLSNDRLHARYEAVVAAWEELTGALDVEVFHHAELAAEAKFLSERLRSFHIELVDEDAEREFGGHVAPSLARLDAVIAKIGGDA